MSADCVVHVISDALGDTAAAVVAAAVSQFPQQEDAHIGRLSQVSHIDQITEYLDDQLSRGHQLVVFHTLTDRTLRDGLIAYAWTHGIQEVDLLGPALDALTRAFGTEPIDEPGALHDIDEGYIRRIDAMEYTVNHDDGRNEHDLDTADIVLIGVSRTSKTPLSLILASRGYKVANIPLALGVKPPEELYEIDNRKIFGLMSTVQVVSEIRARRIGAAALVASDYADPAKVQEDLDEARNLMRRLGCIVVHTENRAIEETAQVILRYYNAKSDA